MDDESLLRTAPGYPEPLHVGEIFRLATYNDEKRRGLVHTSEYQQEMAALQERFDHYAPSQGHG